MNKQTQGWIDVITSYGGANVADKKREQYEMVEVIDAVRSGDAKTRYAVARFFPGIVSGLLMDPLSLVRTILGSQKAVSVEMRVRTAAGADEAEEEATPKPKAKSPVEEEEEPPKPKKPKPAEEEEEPPKPKAKLKAPPAEEEEEPPKPKKAKPAAEEEEPAAKPKGKKGATTDADLKALLDELGGDEE